MLAAIDTHAPVDYKFEDLVLKPPDYLKLKELLKELEFTKLLKDVVQEEPGMSPHQAGEYASITDIDELKRMMAEIKHAGETAIAVRTAGSQRVKATTVRQSFRL